jgi:branched-chain amino acid transport system substrate-binding protein
MKRLVAFVLAGTILVAVVGSAEINLPGERPEAQELYAQAQKFLNDKDYREAVRIYQELIDRFEKSRYRDVYYYGMARAYYLAGEYRRAAELTIQFLDLFSQSYLTPNAHFLLGNCQFRLERPAAAFSSYLSAYVETRDKRLKSLSERSLLATIEAGYFPVDSLLIKVPDSLICRVKARMAYSKIGQWSRSAMDSLMGDCPDSLLEASYARAPRSGQLYIGLITPLTGPYAKYGQAMLDGAMLAAERLSDSGIHTELLVYDTKADNTIAVREALALVRAKVDLVVGPLLSSVAVSVAAAMACYDIPLLVPAASQAGFTDLSPNCFQMSPNVITVGRGLAQYAVKFRQMKSLAVVSPTSLDELTMAEAFATEAQRLGVPVAAFERFHPDETDFGAYLSDLKDAVIGPVVDSLYFVTLEGDTLEPWERPVSLDGIFLPAVAEQLFMLLPQISANRITAPYLGADEWNTESVLKLGDRVLRDAVIYSGQAAMSSSSGFSAFSTAFVAKSGEAPDRLAALGYDAVNLAASAYRQQYRGPEGIIRFLRQLRGYQGVSGRITFDGARSNRELPLFVVRNGRVEPLTDQVIFEPAPDTEVSPDTTEEYMRYDW